MCSIFGAVFKGGMAESTRASVDLRVLMRSSEERGRDGRGWMAAYREGQTEEYRSTEKAIAYDRYPLMASRLASVIGNTRAEPTTEYVKDKAMIDQQPYTCRGWAVVHNGTIANDAELREITAGNLNARDRLDTTIDSAAIVEMLGMGSVSNFSDANYHFQSVIRDLKGSFAILATHTSLPGVIFYACNYRPIWYSVEEYGVLIGSTRDYFGIDSSPQMILPYTMGSIRYDAEHDEIDFRKGVRLIGGNGHVQHGGRALVVCSGGLDSVVAARLAQRQGYAVELLHFQYGSRAEKPELRAVTEVAARLGVKLHIFPMAIYSPKDSPLLRSDSAIAGGETGAEFAHEWVPARNLVMLSLATAYAEANGFNTIVLGNNLEEAGAYPDNEPEFISRFNDLLPFAVKAETPMRVVMPVGNLMKHEIVATGEMIGAPLDVTWSCYRAGETHCGTCGPCFMRRTAYQINGIEDPMHYERESE